MAYDDFRFKEPTYLCWDTGFQEKVLPEHFEKIILRGKDGNN
tara:strand:- start:27106 stop:27231 length:126 start_codon:yes stop_codon:yes gene_type:complete